MPERLLGSAPKASSPAVRKRMQGNKASGTKPELVIRRALWSHGVRGYRLNVKNLPGKPDIAFVGRRIAIFIHGCFWHKCPYCSLPIPKTNSDYWIRKLMLNQLRDTAKVSRLADMGWTVIELWECQVKDDIQSCVEQVKEAVKQRSKAS